jgi:predicted NAD/FAD-dependent oxidoreductase
MSTRRQDHLWFDHGAQYFTAKDERFASLVERW